MMKRLFILISLLFFSTSAYAVSTSTINQRTDIGTSPDPDDELAVWQTDTGTTKNPLIQLYEQLSHENTSQETKNLCLEYLAHVLKQHQSSSSEIKPMRLSEYFTHNVNIPLNAQQKEFLANFEHCFILLGQNNEIARSCEELKDSVLNSDSEFQRLVDECVLDENFKQVFPNKINKNPLIKMHEAILAGEMAQS